MINKSKLTFNCIPGPYGIVRIYTSFQPITARFISLSIWPKPCHVFFHLIHIFILKSMAYHTENTRITPKLWFNFSYGLANLTTFTGKPAVSNVGTNISSRERTIMFLIKDELLFENVYQFFYINRHRKHDNTNTFDLVRIGPWRVSIGFV